MSFDYGDLFTRSLQITWRNKVFWLLSAVPMLVSSLFFPLFFLPVLFLDGNSGGGRMETIIIILMIAASILLSVLSLVLGSYTMSATTLGVLRAESGEGSLALMDLLRDGGKYFGRILVVMLVIGFTIGMVFTLFFLCVFAATMVTMGLASICAQPIIIVMAPLSYLVLALTESAQAAVVADDMSAMDALKRALQLVRSRIWTYMIITLIVYVGITILSGIAVFPLMFPFFGVGMFAASSPSHLDSRIFPLIMLSFLCIFFPLMSVVQGVVMTFMKSSLALTYLRFTRNSENQAI
jgi:hypothetical protein